MTASDFINSLKNLFVKNEVVKNTTWDFPMYLVVQVGLETTKWSVQKKIVHCNILGFSAILKILLSFQKQKQPPIMLLIYRKLVISFLAYD
jgi:hypothetical protein